jgi:hypothetical protein
MIKQESAKDEETLESLYESMTGLMKMLREPEGREKKGRLPFVIASIG